MIGRHAAPLAFLSLFTLMQWGCLSPSPASTDRSFPMDLAAFADGDAAQDGFASQQDLSPGEDCTLPPPGAPASSSYPFMLGGQLAWSHDEGSPSGYFHTYDALRVGRADDKPHKVHVFLPRGYGRCDVGYPVLYMNDGDTAFWGGGGGGKSWRVQDVLTALYAASAIPKIIVVAIVPVNRDAEYSHVQVGPTLDCCQADRYVSYVADAVRPFINRSYRTKTDAASTIILGSSRGGLSSFYLATRRPEVFGKAGCMSSSFWAGLDPVFGGSYPGGPLSGAPLVTQVQATLQNRALRPRLWMDWGMVRTGGTHNSVIEEAAARRGQEMVGLLQSSFGYEVGRELFWQQDPAGEHDEITWSRRLGPMLRSLL